MTLLLFEIEQNTKQKPVSVAMLAFFLASFEKGADLIRLWTVGLNMSSENAYDEVKVGTITNIPVGGHEGEMCIKCGNEEDLEYNPTHHYLPHFEIYCPKCGVTIEYEVVRQVIKIEEKKKKNPNGAD